MKIDIRQAGGFANIVRTRQVDTTKLDKTEADNVEKLVKDADFFNQPDSYGNLIGCDLPQYDIKVEDNGKTKSMHILGLLGPDKFQPFFDWCKNAVNKEPADANPVETTLTDIMNQITRFLGW